MTRSRRWSGFGYLLPALLFLVALFGIPLLDLLRVSFAPTDAYNGVLPGFTTDQYRAVLTQSFFFGSLGWTVLTAVLVAVCCVVLAYPVAALLAGARSGLFRTILLVIVISPLLTSVVVRTYGWVVLFSQGGPINRLLVAIGVIDRPIQLLNSYVAVVVAVVHVLLPFAIIPLVTALRGQDPNLRRASVSLGAGPIATFWRVTVPLSLHGILSGALIVFALAMGIYITPLLVGGVTQPLAGIRIYTQVTSVFDYPVAAALSFALLALTLVCVGGLAGVFRRWERALYG